MIHLSDAYAREASSPLLSSSGCRSGFKEAAAGQKAAMELWGMTALGNGPQLLLLALAASFQPLPLLGQRAFPVA